MCQPKPRRASSPAPLTLVSPCAPPRPFPRLEPGPARPPGTNPCALLGACEPAAAVLAEALSRRGYLVLRAGCAVSALAAARSGQRIDLVVLHGPMTRAGALLRRLRLGLPGVRIVLAGDAGLAPDDAPLLAEPRRLHA